MILFSLFSKVVNMPIFEYHCNHCGANLEELQKHSDPPLIHCPECNHPSLQRSVSKSAFHLKGGGWYKDGYGVVSSNSDSSTESSTSPKESTPSQKTNDNPSSSSDATAA